MKEPSFTFGIEEEYHLVDLATRGFAPIPPAADGGLRGRARQAGRARVLPLPDRDRHQRLQGLHGGAPGARAPAPHHCRRSRAKHGLAPIAASTHPFADRSTLETTPKARYQALARDFAGIGRRLAICGMHVHVGIDDDELRIDLMNQARYFLPHLLMLSTSSPFWQGEDTGLKSYRLAVFHELPRTGLPQRFESYRRVPAHRRGAGAQQGHRGRHQDLVGPAAVGQVPHAGDARHRHLHAHRRRDLDRGALSSASCACSIGCAASNQKWRSYPSFLIEENRWRAQRYGVSDRLFDFGKGELVPFATLIDELLDLIAEDAAVLGCEREAKHALKIATGGTSADRQVQCYEKLLARRRQRR